MFPFVKSVKRDSCVMTKKSERQRVKTGSAATREGKPSSLKMDRSLVEAAIKIAGSNHALAERLGVGDAGPSRWGKSRPLPRHLRRLLQIYVQGIVSPEPPALSPPPGGGGGGSGGADSVYDQPDQPATYLLTKMHGQLMKLKKEGKLDVLQKVSAMLDLIAPIEGGNEFRWLAEEAKAGPRAEESKA
jgi:hypothetical protein